MTSKRHTVDIEAKIKMGTAPEIKRGLFEDLKADLAEQVTVHYADFFTVAPGVQCFRFIISAMYVDVAESHALLSALFVLGDEYPFEVFLRG